MSTPKAAPPTSPTPGMWIVVDLKPKKIAPGSQRLRGLIIAPANTTGGNITLDTQLLEHVSFEDCETAAGQGSLPALMRKKIQDQFPNADFDLVCPTGSGGNAATGTITFTIPTALTAGYAVRIKIMGRVIDVPWNVGESIDDIVTKCVTYIGRYARDLFVIPTNSTGGVLTLTAKAKGPVGNDVTISVQLLDGAGGTATASGAKLTGGTTEPDFTTAISYLGGIEYDFIVAGVSNTDAVATTGNVARLRTFINSKNTGPQSKLAQLVVGHTGLRTAVPTQTAATNDQVVEIFCAQNALSLPCEVGAAEAADRMNFRSLYYSYNRIGNILKLYASSAPTTDNPSTNQSDTALNAGVSVGIYDQSKPQEIKVCRAVTTYHVTDTGAQVLVTDCNEIDAIYEVTKDLRAFLPSEYTNTKVAKDLLEGEEDLPEGVVEEKDIRASVIDRIEGFWIPKGVINKAHFRENVSNGTLTVKVDDVDETQVNIFVPLKPFKNLAKFSAYVAKDG